MLPGAGFAGGRYCGAVADADGTEATSKNARNSLCYSDINF